MTSISIKVNDCISEYHEISDPYSFIRDVSISTLSHTYLQNTEIVISGVSMNDGDFIRHENVIISDVHGVLTMKGKNIDTVKSVCTVYLYLKEGKYDKDNIDEIRTIIRYISRFEFDYTVRRYMACLLDEYLFSQIYEDLCYSNRTIFHIKWCEQKESFITPLLKGEKYISPGDIFLLVQRKDAELFLSFLLDTHDKILVCLPNRGFNRYLKKDSFRSSKSLWEPNRDEFFDFIKTCISVKGFSFNFCSVGDRVNDEPMYFAAVLKKG